MTIFDEMVEALHPHNKNEKESAQQEVMQQIALYGIMPSTIVIHC